LRRLRVHRLTYEALLQGDALSQEDLACILGLSLKTIKRVFSSVSRNNLLVMILEDRGLTPAQMQVVHSVTASTIQPTMLVLLGVSLYDYSRVPSGFEWFGLSPSLYRMGTVFSTPFGKEPNFMLCSWRRACPRGLTRPRRANVSMWIEAPQGHPVGLGSRRFVHMCLL
jgi:hypothetical protein